MQHSKILRATSAASAVLAAVVATASAAPSPIDDGWLPLAQARDGETSVKLAVWRTLQQSSPYREAQFSLAVQFPKEDDGRGGFTTYASLTGFPIRASDRPSRPLNVEAQRAVCGVTAVVGVAHARVAKVVLVDAEGHRRPVRLRATPKAWAYTGHMIGSILKGSVTATAALALDRRGHTLQTVPLSIKAC